MNISLNAQLISAEAGYRSAGVNNYSRRLLAALGEEAQAGATHHRFTAFVHTSNFAAPGVELVYSRLPLECPAARIAWEQVILPPALAQQRAEIVHGLVNVLPLAAPLRGVVTVHDLSFVRTPQALPPLKRAYLTRLCAASVARAAAVIAVSRQTAADVHHFFGAPETKIHVVPNGVGPEFTPGSPVAAERFRRARGLPARYLLYLGTLEPRKNLELLVRAFGAWRRSDPASAEVKLILAGGRGWYYDTIFRAVAALGLQAEVLFPGFVPAEELPDWYRAAAAFVYPSLFEGFGLPVLEAMACGVPVICSRTPSLLEIAGEAALAVPPEDAEAWANAIRLLGNQPALAAHLAARGRTQAAGFSWRRCAQRTIQVYNEIA